MYVLQNEKFFKYGFFVPCQFPTLLPQPLAATDRPGGKLGRAG